MDWNLELLDLAMGGSAAREGGEVEAFAAFAALLLPSLPSLPLLLPQLQVEIELLLV